MKPEETPCPSCGHIGLEIGWRLVAKPIGTFSLAGQQTKVSATRRLRWRCPECDASGPAGSNDEGE